MSAVKVYRLYSDDGHEFGIDFWTLAEAREVKATYMAAFPKFRYYIRVVPL